MNTFFTTKVEFSKRILPKGNDFEVDLVEFTKEEHLIKYHYSDRMMKYEDDQFFWLNIPDSVSFLNYNTHNLSYCTKSLKYYIVKSTLKYGCIYGMEFVITVRENFLITIFNIDTSISLEEQPEVISISNSELEEGRFHGILKNIEAIAIHINAIGRINGRQAIHVLKNNK